METIISKLVIPLHSNVLDFRDSVMNTLQVNWLKSIPALMCFWSTGIFKSPVILMYFAINVLNPPRPWGSGVSSTHLFCLSSWSERSETSWSFGPSGSAPCHLLRWFWTQCCRLPPGQQWWASHQQLQAWFRREERMETCTRKPGSKHNDVPLWLAYLTMTPICIRVNTCCLSVRDNKIESCLKKCVFPTLNTEWLAGRQWLLFYGLWCDSARNRTHNRLVSST